jgi:hypothetical protein
MTVNQMRICSSISSVSFTHCKNRSLEDDQLTVLRPMSSKITKFICDYRFSALHAKVGDFQAEISCFRMTKTRDLLRQMGLPRDCITSITRKGEGNLSYATNEWSEILAPTEVNLANIILTIDISMEKDQSCIIKFFHAEGQ